MNRINDRLETYLDLMVELDVNTKPNKSLDDFMDLMLNTYDGKLNLNEFKIVKIYNPNIKCYKITIHNTYLEYDEFLNVIFEVVTRDKDIYEYAPDRKIFLATGYMRDKSIFNLHPNLLINKSTTLEEYTDMVNEIIQKRYIDGYLTEDILKADIILHNPDFREDSKVWKNVSRGFKPNSRFSIYNKGFKRGFHTSSRFEMLGAAPFYKSNYYENVCINKNT